MSPIETFYPFFLSLNCPSFTMVVLISHTTFFVCVCLFIQFFFFLKERKNNYPSFYGTMQLTLFFWHQLTLIMCLK